jgi:hypothetical protein
MIGKEARKVLDTVVPAAGPKKGGMRDEDGLDLPEIKLGNKDAEANLAAAREKTKGTRRMTTKLRRLTPKRKSKMTWKSK